jgi:hypothetical protein
MVFQEVDITHLLKEVTLLKVTHHNKGILQLEATHLPDPPGAYPAAPGGYPPAPGGYPPAGYPAPGAHHSGMHCLVKELFFVVLVNVDVFYAKAMECPCSLLGLSTC